MQYTMTRACEWYNDNKLSLNNSKCNTMVIDLASVSNTQQINILCNGVLCKPTKAMKYLGITINDTYYEITKNALMHTRASLWNALPRDIKCCTSLVQGPVQDHCAFITK